MIKTNACERCGQSFSNKGALDRHMARKKPCIAAVPLASMENPLAASVFQARNIIRAQTGITGMEALSCINAIIIWRELEQVFPEIANVDAYTLGTRDRLKCEAVLKSGFHCFSKAIKESFKSDSDGDRDWANDVRTALKLIVQHNTIGPIIKPFMEGSDDLFIIKNSRTAYELIHHVAAKMVFDRSRDSMSDLYMSVVKGSIDGKELGQFFTPPQVVNFVIGAATHGLRNLGHVLDPTCGSGSFLAKAAQLGYEVTGFEIDQRVSAIGMAHVLVASGRTANITRVDFLRIQHSNKYDTILANPPFGIKGINYEELTASESGKEIYPLKSSATGFFIQRIVHQLQVGGRGVVVLPLGKELGGKAAGEVKFRHALMCAVDILRVVEIPSGAFENTGIKTAIIVFDKCRELGECIIRSGAKQTTTAVAKVELVTTSIEFSVMGSDTILEVPMDVIAAKSFSLSSGDYRISELAIPLITEGLTFLQARLDDIASIEFGERIIKSDQPESATIPVYGGGGISFKTTKFNRSGRTCKISRFGVSESSVVTMIEGEYWLLDSGCTIRSKSEEFAHTEWIWWMLWYQSRDIINCCKGACQSNLDVEAFKEILVPLPPLEIQKVIATKLDILASDAARFKESANASKRMIETKLADAIYSTGSLGVDLGWKNLQSDVYEVKLGDICQMTSGKFNSKDKNETGQYPFYTASYNNPAGFGDQPSFDFPEYIIFVKDGGNAHDNTGKIGMGRAWYQTSPTCGTSHVLALHDFRSDVYPKYLALYLDITAPETRTAVAKYCTGLGTISQSRLIELIVPLPSLKEQKSLVAELDQLTKFTNECDRLALVARQLMCDSLNKVLSTETDDFSLSDLE